MNRNPEIFSNSSTGWKTEWRSIEIVSCLFIGLLVVAILMPDSPLYKRYLERDSGVFHYIGWLITQGRIPYLDVWDHKPPIVFFINALGLFLSGGSRWGVWGIEVVFLFLSGLVSFNLLKRYFGFCPGFLATLAWMFSLPHLLCGSNQATEYGLLFQFLFMFIFSKKLFGERAGRYWFALGVLSGLLFLTKQNLMGISLAAVFAAMVIGVRDHKAVKMAFNLTKFAMGGTAVIVIFVIYFGINNALADFWSAAFLYNFAYSSVDFVSRLTSLAIGLRILKTSGLSYLALSGNCIALVWLILPKTYPKSLEKIIQPSPLLVLCMLDFPLELAMVSVSGRSYEHYFIALLPVFAFFVAVVLRVILTMLELILSQRCASRLCCIVVLGLFGVLQIPYLDNYFPFCGVKTSAQIEQVLQAIQENSAPQDKVLVLGAESSLNFLAKRFSPSRYVYQYPLIQRGYGTQKLWESFFNEIVDEEPVVIVNTTSTDPIFMGYQPGYWDGSIFVEEFLSFEPIQHNCRLDETILYWDLYRCDWGI